MVWTGEENALDQTGDGRWSDSSHVVMLVLTEFANGLAFQGQGGGGVKNDSKAFDLSTGKGGRDRKRGRGKEGG